MLDIKFVRENPEAVKENIKKKFQDDKLPLVDEVIKIDEDLRAAKTKGDNLRAEKNQTSKEIGGFMQKGEKDKAEEAKKKVAEINEEITNLEAAERDLAEELKKS
ncbi:MAG: serine--tRNA ligase, partial [Anaerococcus vaginalis]|nr:serine--tRNA ligase [Anaerococcus vaginalis]